MLGRNFAIRQKARDFRTAGAFDTLAQDVRYGARLLRRAPAFTVAAVLSLGIGIGSAAAVFNVADAALFRPLPVLAPEQLRQVRATLSLGAGRKVMGGVDMPTLLAMQRASDLGHVVGFRVVDDVPFVAASGTRRNVRVELASSNYFEALRVPALAGRMPSADDPTDMSIVVSEHLWRNALGSDPGVVGRAVTLNGAPAVIAGVTRSYRGLVADRPADVFAPLSSAAIVDRATASAPVRLLLRLDPGVPTAVAEERVAALYVGSASSLVRGDELRVELLSAQRGVSDAREALERPLWIGLAFAGALLLVACANTGGLLLARFASRRGEFAIRLAIGAGRARLVRQLVVEALLLAGIAAAAGLLVSRLTAPVLLQSIPIGAAALDFELRFDWRLVAFTAVAASFAALFAAGASLWRLFRSDPASMLVSEARSIVPARRRLAGALIAAQVACSLLLMVGAGSMSRSLINLHAVDPGFDTTRTFALTVDTAGRILEKPALAAYYGRLRDRLLAAPYIGSVSVVQFPLLTGAATTGTVDVAGFTPATDDDRWVRMFFVGPEFFETLGMRLVLGRGIGPNDMAARDRVAVVNKEFARFYFGRPDLAIGRHVNGDVRIVGVAADAQYNTLRDRPVRAMFVPYTQPGARASMAFMIRPSGDRGLAMSSALQAARAHDPELKLKIMSLEDQVLSTLSRERFVAALAGALSALAIFLSCGGLYGSVAYSVSERRSELAVRLALGATRTDIVRLMLGTPLRTAAVGLIVGVPAVYVAMRGVSSLLFGVAPFDMWTLLACSGALLIVVTAAVVWPARRAARIDPLEALKSR
jgi:predicted permease